MESRSHGHCAAHGCPSRRHVPVPPVLVADGHRRRLVPAALGIFGHGNVAGLGQALDQHSDALPFIQGRNEQALVHMTGFAKVTRRRARRWRSRRPSALAR